MKDVFEKYLLSLRQDRDDKTEHSDRGALETLLNKAAEDAGRNPDDIAVSAGSEAAYDGAAFAIAVSTSSGIGAGITVSLVSIAFTDVSTAVTVGAAGLAIVLITPAWGWLQGERRFGGFALVSVAERCELTA